MEGIDTSMSSRSFRGMLLTASIWSLFKQDTKKPTPASANFRAQSSATEKQSTRTESSGNMTFKGSEEASKGSVQSDTPLVDNEPGMIEAPGSTLGYNPSATFNGKTDPFAGGVDGGIEYKTMVWWHAGMVMVAETISLGILSLPMAMATLGIIPGLILLVGLGAMASYSGYVIGQFKIAYPHIHSWADAGEILFGKYGREILGAGQLLFFVFIMGSHILTFSVMMNAITDHGTCTIVFMVIGTVISLVFTLPRTLKNLSYYSVASFVSIIAAVLITMIAVSITRPGKHLDTVTGHWVQDVRLWPQENLDFHSAFLAMTNMVFAYAGHVAFFSFISELKDPKEFPKALAFLQISDISMYIVTAIVVYYYAGNNVASPALDSSGPLIRKIAYGVAIPTIVIAGVVNGHVAVKYLYIRLLRNNKEDIIHQRSFKAIGYWVGICAALWILAWVIAEAIPVFNDLLGVTSALFASWFTFGLSGVFWFFLNFERGPKWWQVRSTKRWTWEKCVALIASCLNLVVGTVICVVGLYASGKSIALNSHDKKPFSCADNSGFRG